MFVDLLCIWLATLFGEQNFCCLSEFTMNTCKTISGHTSSVDLDSDGHWRIAKVETFLGSVWAVSRGYRLACGELLACSKRVWNMCRALLAPRNMGTQQARRSPFVFCQQFYTHTLTLSHDCFFPLNSFNRSLACFFLHSITRFFLPASPTHSVAPASSLPDPLASPLPHFLAQSRTSILR